MELFKRQSKKILIGIIGGLVMLLGLIMIPYPGPGWLVVFAGLAILATEFAVAARILHFARERYDQWVEWLKRQHIVVRILVLLITGIVVVVTVWLLNAFGLIVDLFNLPYDWLISPLFR